MCKYQSHLIYKTALLYIPLLYDPHLKKIPFCTTQLFYNPLLYKPFCTAKITKPTFLQPKDIQHLKMQPLFLQSPCLQLRKKNPLSYTTTSLDSECSILRVFDISSKIIPGVLAHPIFGRIIQPHVEKYSA